MLVLLCGGVAVADLPPSFEEQLFESSGVAVVVAVVLLASIWAVATFRRGR